MIEAIAMNANFRALTLDELDQVSGGKKPVTVRVQRCTTTIYPGGKEVQKCTTVSWR
jgi:hypothetical protein